MKKHIKVLGITIIVVGACAAMSVLFGLSDFLSGAWSMSAYWMSREYFLKKTIFQ